MPGGSRTPMTGAQADAWYHTFVSAAYILPVLGAFLADALIGKYLVILLLSLVYCIGHFTLAMNDTRLGLVLGLGLIALGAGGIKPCVSANVGDQFGALNQHLISRMFNWFYFAINFGSAFSTMLIPWMLEPFKASPGLARILPSFLIRFLEWCHGPRIAFGVPGIAMLVATAVFWRGRRKFVHIPPPGLRQYARELFQRENFKALLNLLILVPFAAMFWALWQQNFSSWVVQAEQMNRHLLRC